MEIIHKQISIKNVIKINQKIQYKNFFSSIFHLFIKDSLTHRRNTAVRAVVAVKTIGNSRCKKNLDTTENKAARFQAAIPLPPDKVNFYLAKRRSCNKKTDTKAAAGVVDRLIKKKTRIASPVGKYNLVH